VQAISADMVEAVEAVEPQKLLKLGEPWKLFDVAEVVGIKCLEADEFALSEILFGNP
jgi:hypothetical protein